MLKIVYPGVYLDIMRQILNYTVTLYTSKSAPHNRAIHFYHKITLIYNMETR